MRGSPLPQYDVRSLTAAETAKLVRVALKKAFPATKFSVRTDRGGSINIRWTDGPTTKRVNAVVDVFEGKGFDGMIDLPYLIDAWVLNGEIIGTCSRGTQGSMGSVPAWGLVPPHDDAERMHFSTWIFTRRAISPAMANRCIAQIAAYWGGVPTPLPVAIASRWGDGFQIADGRGRERVRGDLSHLDDWDSMIHQAAEDRARFVRPLEELHDVDRGER